MILQTYENESPRGSRKSQYPTKEIFTNMLKVLSVREIYFCGTIDDPLAHKDLIGITKHIFDIRSDMHPGMHTNGSIRTGLF